MKEQMFTEKILTHLGGNSPNLGNLQKYDFYT
jgi:hypothetical protein